MSLLPGVLMTATGQPLTVGGYTLVREQAVSKSISEFEYRAVLTNAGTSPVTVVSTLR